jgi:hypothetical protein
MGTTNRNQLDHGFLRFAGAPTAFLVFDISVKAVRGVPSG